MKWSTIGTSVGLVGYLLIRSGIYHRNVLVDKLDCNKAFTIVSADSNDYVFFHKVTLSIKRLEDSAIATNTVFYLLPTTVVFGENEIHK